MAPPPYFVIPPRPQPPIPVPTPPPPVDEGTISDWTAIEPILAVVDGGSVEAAAKITLADVKKALGKPFRTVNVQVEPKHAIVSWHVRSKENKAVVLNAHAHFTSDKDDAPLVKDTLNVR
jgi:DNA recombination-dependent growth factor C